MQISESFNRFGVSESCQHLLVARFDAEPAQVKSESGLTYLPKASQAYQHGLLLQLQAIIELVKGEQQPLSDLHTVIDKALIQKVSCRLVLCHLL